ncbi:NAD(P)/FAD-dependent oxidoreductase [Fodinibius saliphilus]|uniref:NAD(P)/FAD-dependent oxidoreductase n=1 Tax=Fodinibius saliphilus TaxID=1920650 RepID=UPI0011088211|nr:FAD-dependent oxidoreductase [Fodinibius saliphilus]
MSDFYAVVFGAGICGTAIANELNKAGKKVLLIDPHVSEDAPGPPAGLVNPATGMRAKLCWNAKDCYEALRNQIETLMDYSGRDDLVSDSGVLRPAINEKLAKNFKKALDKYEWPEGWVRWMEEEEIEELNPQIASNLGGLYLECGYTVYVDNYLNTYRTYLREQGVACRYEEADYQYDGSAGQFMIQIGDDERTAEHVVVAAGYRTPEFKEWAGLPLEGVKGQIVQFEAEEDLKWGHAVSAKGYCMRRGKRKLIVGSTYEHHFDSLETTEEAYKRIAGKLDIMFEDVSSKVTKQVQMAGVRVTTPNRLPVIGRHPNNDKMCIYTGMNSKGLLYSHYGASLLTDHLVDGKEIPEELDVHRFEG